MTYSQNTYTRTIDGMLKKLEIFEAITKNIANANSVAYKRRLPESVNFKSVLGDVARDNSQGQLKETRKAFDLAIEGDAFFMIETKSGISTTRNGRFQLNKEGELVTLDGEKIVIVEKSKNALNLRDYTDIQIDEQGVISIDGERYGRIALSIQNNKPVRVHQGYIETSNVNIINEMSSLTMVFRSIEASEKVLGMEASVDKDLMEKYGRNV